MNDFEKLVSAAGQNGLRSGSIEIFPVNQGFNCNISCAGALI